MLPLSKRLFGWQKNYDWLRAVYERQLVLDLICRIREANTDPIETVKAYFYWMDDILVNSDRPLVWGFASIIEQCCADILVYLRKKEENEND